MSQDYYKTLGIDKSASDTEIKKAYRKLAMKYHPDRSKGDKKAEEMFKKVSEAYAVLSDAEKRRQYDEFGADGFNQRFSQEDIFRGFDFGDILREFGFGGGASRMRGGGSQFSFGSGFGGMGDSPFGGQARAQRQMKGADLVYELPLTLKEAANGARKTISYEHKGKTERITVTIPKGMRDGKKLRLAGKGEASAYGGPAGDLYIKARVENDSLFSVEDGQLVTHRSILLTEALLGTTISVPTLDDRTLSLRIPPGTRHKTRMRLPGHGLPDMDGRRAGDLFVVIQVTMPKELTDEQRKLVEKLAKTGI